MILWKSNLFPQFHIWKEKDTICSSGIYKFYFIYIK